MSDATVMELHLDDIVAIDRNHFAVVERTYGDVDSHEPYPERDEEEGIDFDESITAAAARKFTKDGVPPKGTVLVRWTYTAAAELLPESKLTLIDRSLLIGDVVKRHSRDAMSGVVVNTRTLCTLQPICEVEYSGKGSRSLQGFMVPWKSGPGFTLPSSGKPPEVLDVPSEELKWAETPTEEDLVIYKDWIGRIEAMTCNLVLKLTDGCAVEISDDLVERMDGESELFSVGDIAQTKKGHLRNGRWLFGSYNPNTPPVGTVVHIRPTTAQTTWLERRIGSTEDREPPALLERDELESDDLHVYDRTRRPKSGEQADIVSNSEIDVRLGLRVRFKDLSGACVKYDGSTNQGKVSRIDRKGTVGYDLNVFDVARFHTSVSVQWQDLSISQHPSIDLIPDTSIDDEHAAWPGEIAHTLDFRPEPGMPGVEEPSRVGVVQSVKAEERMALVRWCPAASLQYTKNDEGEPQVRSLLRAVLGKATGDMQEVSLYDIETPAAMNVRRGDIVLVIQESGRRMEDRNVDWLGEIVDTYLDGTLMVRLGAADEVRDVKLKREDVVVAIRSDGTGEVDGFADEDAMDEMEAAEMALNGTPGAWHADNGSEGSEGDDSGNDWDGEGKIPRATYEDENGMLMDEDEVEDENWESEDEGDEMQHDFQQTPPTSHPTTPLDPDKMTTEPLAEVSSSGTTSEGPEAYLILDSAVPGDHHYRSQPSPAIATRMKRIQKEHRIFQSPGALPNGVYVRGWESRLDLLRVLIVGPADTPYQDAPFVIDFYLPSDYPTAPPEAYFHSWASERGLGGVGRVNPNLYEDGKICLSLLGTWEGSKGEGWRAARSTLLQVTVSLLGLVLVSEPYFNEAGYELLTGLESSKRPSALYNERTFLRSRTFMLSALSRRLLSNGTTSPPGLSGLQDELDWLYCAANGPRLVDKAIRDAEAVLQRSKQGDQESNGRTVMSKGACIPLERVVERLRSHGQRATLHQTQV